MTNQTMIKNYTNTPLFDPLTIRSLTLKNRIAIAPMQMYNVGNGITNDWHLIHLGRFALGGAGLIIMEATAVRSDGRSTLHDTGLWSDLQIENLQRITNFIRSCGSASAIQLQHAGRKSSGQAPWHGFGPLGPKDAAERGEHSWRAWAPDRHGWSEDHPECHAMTEKDMDALLADYRIATQRAVACGFDAVEIHAAHGYLLHSFLSPLSNKRTDHYGGSLENRMRFPLAVVRAVREAWPNDRPLLCRIASVDGNQVGWQLNDSITFAKRLKAEGVDVIHCSSGGMNLPSRDDLVTRYPGFQIPFAEKIRAAANIPAIGVGLITKPEQANEIIKNERADIIALGREALWNPNWPLHAAISLNGKKGFSEWPRQFGWWLSRRYAKHKLT